jgi:autotransporter adhesin
MGTVSVGGTVNDVTTVRQIQNVAAGDITETSTDAVNGSQLYATNTNLANLTTRVANMSGGGGGGTTTIDYVKSNKPEGAYGASADGANSSALGYNSSAAGVNSTAVGNGSSASKTGATALGEGAQATTANSVALGTASTTTAAHTGTTATTATITAADGTTSTATYAGPASDTKGTVSVGSADAERQLQNVAAGEVSATSTDAINGSQLNATNTNVSNLTTRVGTDETKITNLKTAVDGGITFAGNTGSDAVALGKTVIVEGTGTTAGTYTGANIKTAETYDTNTGKSTIEIMMTDTPVFTSVTAGTFTTSGTNTITISGNTGTITGLTNKTWSTTSFTSGRAATEDQLNAVQTQVTNIETGSGIDYVKSDKTVTTTPAVSTGADSSALGYGSSATGSKSTAAGNNAKADFENATALGEGAQAGATNATAVGEGAQATGANSTAVGEGAKAGATNATAVGEGAQATGANSTAVGEGAKATKENSVALGAGSTTGAAHTDAAAQTATIIGTDGKETTATYAGQASDTNGTVSVGTAKGERQIQNVAAGDVSATSTDAVNGSQLNATNTNVSNLTSRVGTDEVNIQQNTTDITTLEGKIDGGITFAGNTGSKAVGLGKTFTIQGEGTKADSEYSGSNIKTVVDGNTLTIKMDENPSFTSVTATSVTATSMSATSITAGSGSTQVLIDNTGISVGGNTYISSVGINANNQVITNVAAGSVTAGSTEAVNGNQLYETNQAVAKNAQDIANINNGFSVLDNKIDKVGAGAAALAGLHPLEFDPTDRFSMSTGVGTYRGEHALAMGAFYRPTESTMYSVGSELGNSNNMWTVGVSFKFGADKNNPASRSNMVREIMQLKAENKAMKADNLAMKAELNEIKQQLAQLAQKK